MTELRVKCSAEDHGNVFPLDEKQQQRNCLVAWNEYSKRYSPAGLFLSPVLLLHNRCAHGGYRADPLLFQKQDSLCVQGKEHE